MWGTLLIPVKGQYKNRFIPTDVGNTDRGGWFDVSIAVHPHGCGEHEQWIVDRFDLTGSSPRMWGTLKRLPYNSTINPVHPHGCGEHSKSSFSISVFCGSSPRMWGTLCGSSSYSIHRRFIPTDVGNTKDRHRRHRRRAVHPHGCGEHLSSAGRASPLQGSSPRMWGTLECKLTANMDVRFIPTDVGNTV